MSVVGVTFVDPSQGRLVNSGWGSPRTYRGGWHEGLDFAMTVGLPVYAAAAGKVEFSGFLPTDPAGELIILNHDGSAKTRYMHLSKRLVAKGGVVTAGELIGYSGSSGIKQSAAHLHFDLRLHPLEYAKYVTKYGTPDPSPPRKSDGFFAVPAEPLIPANYMPAVLANATKRGVSPYTVAAAASGVGLILLGFGLIGAFIYRRYMG